MCQTVAAREVEIPYYKGMGKQRGRGFGAFAHVIGRTPFLFLKKHVVPAARRISADMLGFAVSEIVDVVSGKQIFETAAKNVGRQTLRKQLGGGSGEWSASSCRSPL